MLVYIASYPHSGDAVIRSLIHTHFRYPTSSLYPNDPPYPERFPYATNWRLGSEITITNRKRFWMVWNQWIGLFDWIIKPAKRDIRFLLYGCEPSLTPGNRRRLATEETVFFVKTHEGPYDTYFDGEFVLQTLRHPGPAFRALQRTLPDTSMTQVINGETRFGSWSDYIRTWDHVFENMSSAPLRLYFDDIVSDHKRVCGKIGKMTGLTYIDDAERVGLDDDAEFEAGDIEPDMDEGWEHDYTRIQLQQLWQQHQGMMRHLGFSEPDFDSAQHEQ